MRNIEILLHASSNILDLDSQENIFLCCYSVDEFAHRLYTLTTDSILTCFSYSPLLPASTLKMKYQEPLIVDTP
jgi:hypothetical protein